MVNLSFGDMIVIRWSSTFDKREGLRGLTNQSYNFGQLKALGFWDEFVNYFRMAENVIKLDPDPIDLGLMATLAIITADRDLYKKADRIHIYPVQEHVARLLKTKCDLQGMVVAFY